MRPTHEPEYGAVCVMSDRQSSETVVVYLEIRKTLHQYMSDEAKKHGRSLAEEIISRLQSFRDEHVRQETRYKITSTVEAVDSTINAIERLLTIVKPMQPPELPKIDPAERLKGHR
jgi:hypothetical protein